MGAFCSSAKWRISNIVWLAAIIGSAGVVGGCGSSGIPELTSAPQAHSRTHNKVATKVLADIAVQTVRGRMPARVASRRGRDML